MTAEAARNRFRYPEVRGGREYNDLFVVGPLAATRDRKWWCRCLRCGHERAVTQKTIAGPGHHRCPNTACRLGFQITCSRTEQNAHPVEFATWRGMLWRCHLAPPVKVVYAGHPFPHPHWVGYRGRGILVCTRWRVFANFLADMGSRPAGMSIDRISAHGHYEPGNCRWATPTEQSRNRRNTRRYSLIRGGLPE